MFLAENLGDDLLEILSYVKKTDNTVIDIKIEKSTLEERFIDIAKEGVS